MFKRDDRVIYTGRGKECYFTELIGEKGTVLHPSGAYTTEVEFDSGRQSGVYTDNLELIKPESVDEDLENLKAQMKWHRQVAGALAQLVRLLENPPQE